MSKYETFRMIVHPSFETHSFNGNIKRIGFVPDHPIGAGYCDDDILWVTPGMHLERAIEVCVHEGIHAAFPDKSEKETERAGKDIARFVMRVLETTRDDFHPQGKAPLNPDAIYEILKAERLRKLASAELKTRSEGPADTRYTIELIEADDGINKGFVDFKVHEHASARPPELIGCGGRTSVREAGMRAIEHIEDRKRGIGPAIAAAMGRKG